MVETHLSLYMYYIPTNRQNAINFVELSMGDSIVLDEILERRAVLMDIILGVIAVISLCCSCFAVGYTLGKDINKTQK